MSSFPPPTNILIQLQNSVPQSYYFDFGITVPSSTSYYSLVGIVNSSIYSVVDWEKRRLTVAVEASRRASDSTMMASNTCAELPSKQFYFGSRRITFLSTVFSTVTIFACIVTLPLFYNHMQRVRSMMLSDVDYCKVSECRLPSFLISYNFDLLL